jgi:hypothetical protein
MYLNLCLVKPVPLLKQSFNFPLHFYKHKVGAIIHISANNLDIRTDFVLFENLSLLLLLFKALLIRRYSIWDLLLLITSKLSLISSTSGEIFMDCNAYYTRMISLPFYISINNTVIRVRKNIQGSNKFELENRPLLYLYLYTFRSIVAEEENSWYTIYLDILIDKLIWSRHFSIHLNKLNKQNIVAHYTILFLPVDMYQQKLIKLIYLLKSTMPDRMFGQ